MAQHTKDDAPLSLAVVGHANTGKTSLIRTLLRHTHFGKVENSMGTTRHVEMAKLLVNNREIIRVFDTPGLEDSMALRQIVDGLPVEELVPAGSSHIHLGRSKLALFLKQVAQFQDFEQEAKVVRQAMNSDVLLYVIDIREPVLGKYQDEIAILSMAGIPIIPVFNFIAIAPDNLQNWRIAMAEFNLHAVVEFDTVAFDFEAEKRLYQKLQSVLEQRYAFIQTLIDYRRENWFGLQQAASQCVAKLIVDIACFRELDESEENTATEQLNDLVRQAEQACLSRVLSLFEFSDADMQYRALPVENGVWSRDLFDPRSLKELGISTGSAAATGAMFGVGVDLAFAGLSLGIATAAGAAVGVGWTTMRRFGKELTAKVKGKHWQCVDDRTVELVLMRQRVLLNKLLHRGHAAQHKITLEQNIAMVLPSDWSKWLKTMRNHPEWSALTDSLRGDENGRNAFIHEMAEGLTASAS